MITKIIMVIMLMIGGVFNWVLGMMITSTKNSRAFWFVNFPMLLFGLSNCYWACYLFREAGLIKYLI